MAAGAAGPHRTSVGETALSASDARPLSSSGGRSTSRLRLQCDACPVRSLSNSVSTRSYSRGHAYLSCQTSPSHGGPPASNRPSRAWIGSRLNIGKRYPSGDSLVGNALQKTPTKVSATSCRANVQPELSWKRVEHLGVEGLAPGWVTTELGILTTARSTATTQAEPLCACAIDCSTFDDVKMGPIERCRHSRMWSPTRDPPSHKDQNAEAF